jgi:hypothetical protein
MNDSMLQNVTLTSSTDLYQDVNYSVSAAAMIPTAGIPAAGMPTVEMPTNGLSSLIRESIGAKLAQQGMVKVEVSELLDTFRVCFENHLQWIEDFRDDSIWITQDLHEVIEAFENMRREMMP